MTGGRPRKRPDWNALVCAVSWLEENEPEELARIQRKIDAALARAQRRAAEVAR